MTTETKLVRQGRRRVGNVDKEDIERHWVDSLIISTKLWY